MAVRPNFALNILENLVLYIPKIKYLILKNICLSFQINIKVFLEPSIRWYRNNEPIKTGARSNAETGYSNGEAWLKLSDLSQKDVAEYKCDASNPAGKATTVASLVLQRMFL